MSRKVQIIGASRLRNRPVKTFEISRKIVYKMFFELPCEYVSALAAAGKLCVKNSAIFTGSSKQTATDKSVGGSG